MTAPASGDESWMRHALEALQSSISENDARDALRGPERLQILRERLDTLMEQSLPMGERADNLLQALIALRVKFPSDEARTKLETNLAMRRGGRA